MKFIFIILFQNNHVLLSRSLHHPIS